MKYILITSTIDESKRVLIETANGVKQFSDSKDDDESFNEWYLSLIEQHPKTKIEGLATGMTYCEVIVGTYSGDAEAKARELIGKQSGKENETTNTSGQFTKGEGDLIIWNDKGLYFHNLEVRELDGDLYRVEATMSTDTYSDYNEMISANSMEEAIRFIRKYDSDYFDEITLYADEG